MEIALGLFVVALLIAAGGLGWFLFRAREDGIKSRTELAALQRALDDAEQRRRDNLDAVRDAARAASLEAAQGFSSKLLDDHKRETEAAKKDSEERVQAASAVLVQQVDGIAKAVAGLHAQLQEKGAAVDTLWRALESPVGAGALAEIGLANTLKAFGLETDRDFVLQHTTQDEETGKRLRPDAVVFLPGENLLVIDCKASKFLLEIARVEGTEAEAGAYSDLARTMERHLRALADKDYRSAVFTARRDAGRGDAPTRVHSMMFLPNEAAIEKLLHADPDFLHKARKFDIILGGPAALHCALAIASTEIRLQRQMENHEEIVKRTRTLLEGIAMALGKAADVGKNLKRAADSFEEFSRSTNRFLLPRARHLLILGLQPGKAIPQNLPAFAVHLQDNVIEGEAEDVGELFPDPPVPRLTK